MTTPEIGPVEILARRICRELLSGSGMDPGQLEAVLTAANRSAQRDKSRKAKRELRLQDGVFQKALELAIAEGWVRASPDACALTPAGMTFARRSRSGTRRARFLV
jgi:hypothetical protein